MPTKPHEWPNLAAKGYKQYEYSSKKLNGTKGTHKNGIIYQAQADIDKGNGFASLTEKLGNQVSMKINKVQNQFAAPENKVLV